MKKLLAVLSVVGVATLITGCSDDMKINSSNNYVRNINDFKEKVAAYSNINTNENTKVILGKYKLSTNIDKNLEQDLKNSNRVNDNKIPNQTNTDIENEISNKSNISVDNSSQTNKKTENTEKLENVNNEISTDFNNPLIENVNLNNIEQENKVSPIQEETSQKADEIAPIEKETANQQISTLYSLSADINDCCEDFTTLKQNLTNAIIETQNLIEKVNSKEIELTNEQKLLIIEQSKQLKDLGRKLSSITTELSISLSDINNLMLNNENLDSLSLKYLIVLDNLVNGNEMLENGLHSLNLINNLFNTTTPLPPNNTGRILYGFRRNNEEPIIKDYLIDQNGNITENQQNQSDNNANENADNESEVAKSTNNTNAANDTNKENKKNIDTMQNSKLNTNIDSYRNHNQNIDSFFNTALLDNEFMYGNGYNAYGAGMNNGLGNGLIYGNAINENMPLNNNAMNLPNNNQYNNFNNSTTNYGVLNNENTQQNENIIEHQKTNKSKKFKFKNNIDTYKDANTPSLTTRFGKVKKSISNFFNKFSKKTENQILNKIDK